MTHPRRPARSAPSRAETGQVTIRTVGRTVTSLDQGRRPKSMPILTKVAWREAGLDQRP